MRRPEKKHKKKKRRKKKKLRFELFASRKSGRFNINTTSNKSKDTITFSATSPLTDLSSSRFKFFILSVMAAVKTRPRDEPKSRSNAATAFPLPLSPARRPNKPYTTPRPPPLSTPPAPALTPNPHPTCGGRCTASLPPFSTPTLRPLKPDQMGAERNKKGFVGNAEAGAETGMQCEAARNEDAIAKEGISEDQQALSPARRGSAHMTRTGRRPVPSLPGSPRPPLATSASTLLDFAG